MIVADLTLRFGASCFCARVHWPSDADSLTLLLADRFDEAESLSAAAGTVVVALTGCQRFELELNALCWVADHAAELNGASRLPLLAGGARAACVAVLAREVVWPTLSHQLLIHPTFTPECPMPNALNGLAPAAVLSDPSDDGAAYDELLDAAGVEVWRLHDLADLRTITR